MHTCTFSSQLTTLLSRSLLLTVLYFNIADGGIFNVNEFLCWRFDEWLWCVELMYNLKMKENTCVLNKYFFLT